MGCVYLAALFHPLISANQSTQNPAVPSGWPLADSKPCNYETGLDPQASYHGFPSAYLKAKQSAVEGFGTLKQQLHSRGQSNAVHQPDLLIAFETADPLDNVEKNRLVVEKQYPSAFSTVWVVPEAINAVHGTLVLPKVRS